MWKYLKNQSNLKLYIVILLFLYAVLWLIYFISAASRPSLLKLHLIYMLFVAPILLMYLWLSYKDYQRDLMYKKLAKKFGLQTIKVFQISDLGISDFKIDPKAISQKILCGVQLSDGRVVFDYREEVAKARRSIRITHTLIFSNKEQEPFYIRGRRLSLDEILEKLNLEAKESV